MFEKTNKRKCFVTEEDISTLLQSYTATTVLGVLQEVSQVLDCKIDWNALVRKTTTGITDAREYQMLWRHLAYRHGLLDKFDDAAEPLDDDSDLDYELEAFPAVSCEAAAEAAACVKVLIASRVPSDSNMPNGTHVEAPLTTNIPNGETSRPGAKNSFHGATSMHTRVPVAVQKQLVSAAAGAEGLETVQAPACGNLPPKRKRKLWSEEEDMELIAAVQRCGEGNWANLLKGDFKGDRTASQLSQRWAIIRKRKGTMVVNGSQLSEAQLAANRAMSLALDMPMGDKLKAASPNTVGPSHNSSESVAANIASGGAQSQHHQDLLSSKPRVSPKMALPKATTSPDSVVKAAALAHIAGTPSNIASVLKTTQYKTIVPGVGPAVKSSVAGSINGLPKNVHFIRTGLVPRSTGPSITLRNGTQQVPGHSLKPTTAAQPNSASTPSRPNASAKTNPPKSAPAPELQVSDKQQLPKNPITTQTNAQREKLAPQVRHNQTLVSCHQLIEKVKVHNSFLGDARKEHKQENQVQQKSVNLLSQEMASNGKAGPSGTENGSADAGDPNKAVAGAEKGRE